MVNKKTPEEKKTFGIGIRVKYITAADNMTDPNGNILHWDINQYIDYLQYRVKELEDIVKKKEDQYQEIKKVLDENNNSKS